MAADIVEAAQHSVTSPHDQRALARHVEREVGAGDGEFAFVADQLPGAPEQEFLLEFQEFVAGVAPGREPAAIPALGDRQIARLHVHEAAS